MVGTIMLVMGIVGFLIAHIPTPTTKHTVSIDKIGDNLNYYLINYPDFRIGFISMLQDPDYSLDSISNYTLSSGVVLLRKILEDKVGHYPYLFFMLYGILCAIFT